MHCSKSRLDGIVELGFVGRLISHLWNYHLQIPKAPPHRCQDERQAKLLKPKDPFSKRSPAVEFSMLPSLV